VHVLENRNLHEPSPKADRVRQLLDPALHGQHTSPLEILPTLLADHQVPPGEPPADASNPRLATAAQAICVHADEDDYGTRSSAIITLDHHDAPPNIRWTGHAPCHGQWQRSGSLWSRSAGQ
jgi:hypothetical protein